MKRTKRIILSIGIFAAVFVLLLLIAAGFFAEKLMFYPPEPRALQHHDSVMLEIEPGIGINAMLIENPQAKYTLLYSHGNAEQLPDLEYAMDEYARRGFSVAAYDYEGYGQSGGAPGEKQLYRDIERVYRYLTEEKNIPPERIIIYGRSVGSGPSCYLAENRKAAALILEAPFSSAFAVPGLDWLPFNRFPNIERIGKINMPLLIFHGDADRLINCRLGRRLYEKALPPKEFVEVKGAGHNNIVWFMGEAYFDKIKNFAAGLDKAAER